MIPLVILIAVFVLIAIWTRKDYTVCPKCGADTMEQGYEGIRRKCSRCDWSNS
jgi:tRNA(Ile2) C34 agmatinyltransferase TiaS